MESLRIETGIVEYNINDKVTIAINPTDAAFVERLFNAFDLLSKKQESHDDEVSKVADKREIFEIARRRDEEMRAIIDDVFEQPVCEALCGRMNLYAYGDGLPVWANILLAFVDKCDSKFANEKKRTDPRMKKYLDKYGKK